MTGSIAITLLPSTLSAAPDDVKAEIKKLYGDKPIKDGKLKIDLPSIAENGLVVPLGFEVESPMTDKDYVKAVHFFAEGNPNPLVASFFFHVRWRPKLLPPSAFASPRRRTSWPWRRCLRANSHLRQGSESHDRRLRRLVRDCACFANDIFRQCEGPHHSDDPKPTPAFACRPPFKATKLSK